MAELTLTLLETTLLVSPDFSARSDAKHIESMKVLSLGNEFRKVMAVSEILGRSR